MEERCGIREDKKREKEGARDQVDGQAGELQPVTNRREEKQLNVSRRRERKKRKKKKTRQREEERERRITSRRNGK